MAEYEQRLVRCFEAVFPRLDRALVVTASPDTVAEWDSLHTLTLIAVIEEEFGLAIPASDYPRLRSYAAIRDHVAAAVGVD